MSRRRVFGWAAVLATVWVLASCSSGGRQSLDDADKKVTLCHFTNGGHYNVITVSKQSVINGDTGHQGHANDVIPPFQYSENGKSKTFAGLNYHSQVDANCKSTSPASTAPPPTQATTPATPRPTEATTPATPTPTEATTPATPTPTEATTPATPAPTEATTPPPATEGPIIVPTEAPPSSEQGSSTTGPGESTTSAGETATSAGETTTTASRTVEVPRTTIVPVTNANGAPVTNAGGSQVSVAAVVATNADGSTVTNPDGSPKVLGVVVTNPDKTPVTNAAGEPVTIPVGTILAKTGGNDSLLPAGLFFIALGGFAVALTARLRRLPRRS